MTHKYQNETANVRWFTYISSWRNRARIWGISTWNQRQNESSATRTIGELGCASVITAILNVLIMVAVSRKRSSNVGATSTKVEVNVECTSFIVGWRH
jgi:hypothetical protein